MKGLGLVLMFALMASCQTEEPEDSLAASIEKWEVDIKEHLELDTAIANKLTSAYIEYVELHPDDSISPFYLSRAADIFKEIPGRTLKCINIYNQVLTSYPESPLAARSVFMIGYVFDDKLKDKERAIKSYSHFIESYPDHVLKEDATLLRSMLQDTLSEEEMVKSWMKSINDTNPKK